MTTIRVLAIDDETAVLETYQSLLDSVLSQEDAVPELEELMTYFQTTNENSEIKQPHFSISLARIIHQITQKIERRALYLL